MSWNPTPGTPQGPFPGPPPAPGGGGGANPPPYGPPSSAGSPPYGPPPSGGPPPYAPPPSGGAPPYGPPGATPPSGGFGVPGGPPPPGRPPGGGFPGRPHGRLSPMVIAVVVLVVVAGGGLGGYFAFAHTSSTLACSGTALDSKCSPATSFGSPTSTTSPTSTPTTISPASSTTTSSVPTTSSSVPTTSSSVPTTSSVPPTNPPPTPAPSGQSVVIGDNISLTLAQGWSVAQSGNPLEVKHSNPGSGFVVQVLQTSASSASDLGQQFLNSTLSQAVTGLQVTDQGGGNLTWTTFTQVAVYSISGTVTTSQGSTTIAGQVFALLNPQTHLGAEIYAVAANATDYTSVNQSVLQMVNSLAD